MSDLNNDVSKAFTPDDFSGPISAGETTATNDTEKSGGISLNNPSYDNLLYDIMGLIEQNGALIDNIKKSVSHISDFPSHENMKTIDDQGKPDETTPYYERRMLSLRRNLVEHQYSLIKISKALVKSIG